MDRASDIFSAVLDSLDSQIAVIDRFGKISYVNEAWCSFARMNGLPAYQWIGTNYLDTCSLAAVHGDLDGADVADGIRKVVNDEAPCFEHEYPCHSPKEQRWFMMRIAPLRRMSGYFVVSHHNITQRKLAEDRVEEQNRELARLATTDKLTGLANRAKLDEVLDGEIYRADRYGSAFAAIMIDIDHFKRINDDFGHLLGDAVLSGVASILHTTIRESDVAGRWGGEEFLVVLPECGLEGACKMAEKLRGEIASTRFPVEVPITCSCGVAAFRAGQSATELTACADAALYRAKRGGRNRVEAGG